MSGRSYPNRVMLTPSMLALAGVMGFSDGAPRSSAEAYRPRPRGRRYTGVSKDEQQRRLFAAASKRERKRARAQGTGMVGGAR